MELRQKLKDLGLKNLLFFNKNGENLQGVYDIWISAVMEACLRFVEENLTLD
jgi:hypothetical protein